MARRGEALREHILWSAKDVLLELGYERASMDLVAARAGTTKRSVYAHFEGKESLFVAAIDMVRQGFLRQLKMPEDYAPRPPEALTLFLSRYLEIILHKGSIQLCRLCIGESGRFHDLAAQSFEQLFTQVHGRVSAYMAGCFGLSRPDADAAAHKLFGLVLHPRFPRALFGIGPLAESYDPEGLSPDFDTAPVRAAVDDVIGSFALPF